MNANRVITKGVGANMFTPSQALEEGATDAAKKMLASGQTYAPIETQQGRAMLYVSTDKSRLRAAFVTLDIDGHVVYVGLPAA